jgi:diguanylate cyclase (GGDEF)-like protein/PAS domain S-box-containing protein
LKSARSARSSLKKQLLITFLALFAIFAVVNLSSNLLLIQYGGKKHARTDLDQSMDVLGKAIEEWFQNKSNFIESVSTLQSFEKQDQTASIQKNLTAIGKLKRGFETLVYVDQAGTAIAATDNSVGWDYSRTDFFGQVKRTGSAFIGFTYGGDEHAGFIVFAYPVLNGPEFMGMVAGFVDRAAAADTLAAYRFGETGRLHLLDAQGFLLSGDGNEAAMEKTELVQAARSGRTITDFFQDSSGHQAFGAFRPLLDGRFLLLAEIRKYEVMSTVYHMMIKGMVFFFFFYLLCIGCLIGFSNKMGATLRLLAKFAKGVREGDYDPVVFMDKRMFRSSETDEIMEAFRLMAVTVSGQLDELTCLNRKWKDSEERYRKMIEYSPDGILFLSKGQIALINPKGTEILGARSKEELVGKPMLSVIHESSHTQVKRRIQRMDDHQGTMTAEERRYIRLDGEVIQVESTVSYVEINGQTGIMVIFRDVTESKRLERAVYESEEKHRFISEYSTDMIMRIDLCHVFLFVSEACTHILGYKPEEMVGQSMLDYIHPVYHELIIERSKRAEAPGAEERDTPVTLRFQIFRRDGTLIWMETKDRAVRNEDGSVRELVAVSRDISERMAMERELVESNKRVMDILSSITDAFFALDKDWKFTFVNRTAEQVSGMTREDMLGKVIWEVLPDLVGTRAYDEFHRAVREQVPIVDYFTRLDRWYEFRAYPGNANISVYIRDVTANKKLEQELLLLSTTDELTGIANRRLFNDVLNREWQRAARLSKPLSMIMLDVDYFKSYNDTYGHQAGDTCLREVASILSESLKRDGDTVFRYGGEEFAIILRDTDELGAAAVAERIHMSVVDRGIRHVGSPAGVLTCSMGIAGIMPTPLIEREVLLARADMALYRAKENGRNQVRTDR